MEKKWIRRSLFILPIVIALAALVIAPKLKRSPEKAEVKERAAKVRAIKVPNIAVLPRAVGYGTTMPARSWEAVAEVAGQVTWLSDELKSGKIVQAGSELLQINDASYQLALTQAETQLQALAVKERTTRSSLALEEKSQALLEKDIARKLKLRKQGAISSSVFEEAERSKLKGESTVQGLKNTLALNAAEREVLKTQVANARLDLERTRLVAPFDARITEVKVGQAQYANRGQLLFSADATDSVEIEARFPIGKLRPLIAGKKSAEGEDVAAVERTPGALKLDAVVRLKTATHTVEWEARVDRVSGVVDPQTQTLGVVVVVDEPYAKARPGQRPALVRNTFVEVELRKKPKGRPLVIPVSAIHNGKVYIANSENRLEIRQVKTAFKQGGAAIIAKGLEAGEWLVVSELTAQEGMLLEPMQDEKAMKRLKMEATGNKGSKR
ncbi:MAG: HlyD family efflux transporter periplasmic adaptor subunit [Candidatus Sedimenticola sp. PURPLELP]